MYTIYIAFQAKKDIALLIKNGGKTVTKKIERILHNFINHPKTGIGMVEQLKGDKRGLWSRRIDKKNRLIYTINEDIVTVEIISAIGYYSDK